MVLLGSRLLTLTINLWFVSKNVSNVKMRILEPLIAIRAQKMCKNKGLSFNLYVALGTITFWAPENV
jgi:hypothetical protein